MDSMSRIKMEEEITRVIRHLGRVNPGTEEYTEMAKALTHLVDAQRIMKLMDNIGKI